jgi:hypothetical protein
MSDLATNLSVERVVLHGIALPEEDLNRFPDLLRAELVRRLESGLPTPASATSEGADESRPLILSSPPDVLVLAREVAERIIQRASTEGAWDG